MKSIKTYELFNESIRDLMRGKSDDEILKSFSNLPSNEILMKSCEIGYLKGVKLAIEKGEVPIFNRQSIRKALSKGYTDIIEFILDDPRVDPSVDRNYAIRCASEYGHTGIVELLLDDIRVDPSDVINNSIRQASYNGHYQIVKMLLRDPRVDPSDDYNYAIKYASRNGHLDVVKLLLKERRVRNKLNYEEIRRFENQVKSLNESVRDLMKGKSNDEILKNIDNLSTYELLMKSCENGYLDGIKLALERPIDPLVGYNYALMIASEAGYTEIVKLLLKHPKVNPSIDNNYAILLASQDGHLDIVKLLLQDKRVRRKLSDEKIKKYENQIKYLNESVRDLMKGKSDEELKDVVDKLLKDGTEKSIIKILLDKDLVKHLTDSEISELKNKLPIWTQGSLNTKSFSIETPYGKKFLQGCRNCDDIVGLSDKIYGRQMIGNAYQSLYKCKKCGNYIILDDDNLDLLEWYLRKKSTES